MATSRRVVIDDTDGQIRYSGQGWFQDQGSQDGVGNFGSTYKHTSHGTNSNDSFSFSFNGTSIAVYGTTSLAKLGKDWDPKWECLVDQVSIASTAPFKFAENNWQFCKQEKLYDGLHTITVNVKTSGQTFWFDQLSFTPSPRTSLDGADLYVENRDPGVLLDSKWEALGDTANMTFVKGSQARFDFIGQKVTWVGFIPTELPHSPASGSFSIDGGSPISFNLNGLAAGQIVTLYNQVFFTTPDLTPGPHSLIVTYNGASGPATPLTLDYLLVTNSSLNKPLGGPTPPSPSGTPPFSSPSTLPTPAKNSRVSPAAIIGGVIGGLALLVLILFILIRYHNRRYREARIKSTNGTETANPPSLPHQLPWPVVNDGAFYTRPTSNTTSDISGYIREPKSEHLSQQETPSKAGPQQKSSVINVWLSNLPSRMG